MRFLLFLFLGLFPLSSFAFRLSPMVVDFAPSGKEATQTVVLENPDEKRVAVELQTVVRKLDINGKENRTEQAPDFVVFPEQLTLEPKQKRNVRITWTGNQNPEHELAFRLVASQLPVTLERPTGRPDVKVNLKFVLQYVASLYVTPPGARPNLSIKRAKLISPGKVELLVKNSGTKRRLLENATVTLKSGERSFTVPEAPLKEIQAQNILAGGERKFILSVPKDFPGANLSAELAFP